MPYKLSAVLTAHSSDVRALVSPNENLVISASRDTTAISWRRSSTSSPFAPSAVLRGGTRYINSVTYIPPSEKAPDGFAVTGGQDSVINIYSLSSSKEDPDFSLVGHTENVCTLDVAADGTIISGSWDKTAKVWINFQLVYDLKGHQQSVWAVLALKDGQYLTGSADKTIKLWQQHKMLRSFQGHNDAVRGLALLPDIGFASCSNDSEIRVWTFGGDAVYTLSGHTSFVYTLAVLPDGNIVSGGEDRSVRVWTDGECAQTIVHPAISVWAVSAMPNGDIVSGCSDGVIRIFSASEERWASEADLKDYDEQVASQALPAQQIGDVKKSDLPGLEALAIPGKKEGDVKMISNGGNVEAHQWDSTTASWQKIGDVVDAVGSGRKQLYNGKEYDYVFDVDFQDGVPPLKLPYNVTENPYSAAQTFLQSNDLPLTYVDEVVRFIEKNTAGVNIGTGGNQYVDPYTGASRYQVDTRSASATPQSSYMDPYTGASRYSGAGQSAPAPIKTATPATLPVSKFVSFKQANVTAMQGKLYQFDEVLRQEISTYSLAMYPDEMKFIDESFSWLSQAVAQSAKTSAGGLNSKHAEAIIQILDRWPSSQRFPVIDLSRLLTGYCPDALGAAGLKERFFEALFKACEWTVSWAVPLSKPRETNILLLFRTIANIFQEGISLDEGVWVQQILEALSQAQYVSLTKAQRVTLATILFNFSCLYLTSNVPSTLRGQHIALILRTETSDSEAIYRSLVALGNVVFAGKAHDNPVTSAEAGEITQCLRALPKAFAEERIKIVTEEITMLL